MKRLAFMAVLAIPMIAFPSFSTDKPVSSISRSLTFPVFGRSAKVGSFWGADRDGGKRKHRGIDIFAKKGTPVVAVSDGVVVSVGNTPVGGKTIWLRSSAHSFTAYYAHLDQHKVKRGARVKKGQIIGTVGKTGNARTTPAHLHFGIYTNKGAVNPYPFVKSSPRTLKVVSDRSANQVALKKSTEKSSKRTVSHRAK